MGEDVRQGNISPLAFEVYTAIKQRVAEVGLTYGVNAIECEVWLYVPQGYNIEIYLEEAMNKEGGLYPIAGIISHAAIESPAGGAPIDIEEHLKAMRLAMKVTQEVLNKH